MEFVARGCGNAVGLWLAVAMIGGLTVPHSPSTGGAIVNFLVIGFVLALVNSLVKPVAKFIAFPLYIITFGLFALVVNGLMLLLTSQLTHALAGSHAIGLHVEGFGSAVLGSIVVSLVSSVIAAFLGHKGAE